MSVLDLFRLDGKVAVVTGSSRGLGLAMAQGFAEAGAHVVLSSRNLDACERAAMSMAGLGVQLLAVRCDVTNPNDVRVLIERTLSRFGRVDILANGAGCAWEEPLEKVSLEQWNRMLAVHATGTLLCCQAAGRQMLQQGSGRIVNLARAGRLGPPDSNLEEAQTSPPNVAGGAVIALTKDLARKWSCYGIRVNAIAPGWFALRGPAGRTEQKPARVASGIPVGRLGEPDDLKAVAVFLASEASAYVTGQVLAVDGGLQV